VRATVLPQSVKYQGFHGQLTGPGSRRRAGGARQLTQCRFGLVGR